MTKESEIIESNFWRYLKGFISFKFFWEVFPVINQIFPSQAVTFHFKDKRFPVKRKVCEILSMLENDFQSRKRL